MADALLLGYYGHRNTGDDALLAVTAWGTHEFLGARRMLALSERLPACYGAPVRPFYLLGNRRLAGWAGNLAAARSGMLVFGGGSNFHAAPALRQLRRFLDSSGAAPCVALGVSVGPFRDLDDEAECGRLLARFDFVGLRDAVSYQRVQALAPDAPAELTCDLALMLPRAMGQPRRTPDEPRRGLGIALCPYERFVGGDLAREEERTAVVAQAVRQLHGQASVDEIVLIDFNGHRRMGDAAVHSALASQLAGLPVRRMRYAADPGRAWGVIAGLRAMLAMRLHAAVFAYATDTPCVMLGYHEKCSAWADTIGQAPALFCETLQLHAADLQRALQLALTREAPRPLLPPDAAMARAARNWEGAAEALARRRG